MVKEHVVAMIEKAEDMLIGLGNMCLEEMGRSRGYVNRTGNLTSSQGFAVSLDGQIRYLSTFDTSIGGFAGRELAIREAEKVTNGMALVVVAGMRYAVYVEAKGYVVTSSAKLMAERVVADMVKKLNE